MLIDLPVRVLPFGNITPILARPLARAMTGEGTGGDYATVAILRTVSVASPQWDSFLQISAPALSLMICGFTPPHKAWRHVRGR
jgi:hypothetical protein